MKLSPSWRCIQLKFQIELDQWMIQFVGWTPASELVTTGNCDPEWADEFKHRPGIKILCLFFPNQKSDLDWRLEWTDEWTSDPEFNLNSKELIDPSIIILPRLVERKMTLFNSHNNMRSTSVSLWANKLKPVWEYHLPLSQWLWFCFYYLHISWVCLSLTAITPD